MKKLRVCKALLDFFLLLTLGSVATVAGYLWMVILSGWVMGEMLFDRRAFHRKYGNEELMDKAVQDIMDSFKGGSA